MQWLRNGEFAFTSKATRRNGALSKQVYYGERQHAFDAIFADELHELQNQGKIAEIDRVFSRDGFA